MAGVDSRVAWFKSKVCSGLELEEAVFDEYLKDSKRSGGLIEFLDGAAPFLLFYMGSSEEDSEKSPEDNPDDNSEEEEVTVLLSGSQIIPERLTSDIVMYFIKSLKLGRVNPDAINSSFEFGILPSGPSLGTLEQLLNQICIPVLSKEAGRGETHFWATEVVEQSGSELLSNMQRFQTQVSTVKQLLIGDTQLAIPALPAESLERAEIDFDLLLQLETAVTDWLQALESLIARETKKTLTGKNPLAELEFWRDRSSSLSGLYQQLNSAKRKRVLAVLEHGNSNSELVSTYKSRFGDLARMFLEAKDNVKFLTTLERHFKTIASGPLARVLETINPMVSALRMVWIISRHYSDDARMGSLMERIAYQIAEKVASEIDLKSLFAIPSEAAVSKLTVGKAVLDAWSDVYMQVRERIEVQGRDPRWEFDRKKLFERTSYMSSTCIDLLHIVQVYYDFHNFLGPELKAVTGDTQGVDAVTKKVAAMIEPVEKLPFDVFDKAYAMQWSATISNFNVEKENIEHLTKAFIDTSFKKLRSAEGALELLRSFKNIKSEGAINKQMMDKFNDIIIQVLTQLSFSPRRLKVLGRFLIGSRLNLQELGTSRQLLVQ